MVRSEEDPDLVGFGLLVFPELDSQHGGGPSHQTGPSPCPLRSVVLLPEQERGQLPLPDHEADRDGLYMMEVDRVLRPGGYWVLSGPPINWKVKYKGWQRTKKDLEAEQNKIEEIAKLLCWEKISEKGETAICKKRVNTESCPSRHEESTVQMRESTNADDVWYKKMKACVPRLPDVENPSEVARGAIKPFPSRLNAIPPRIANGLIPGVKSQAYEKDNKMWKKDVKAYIIVNKYLLTGRCSMEDILLEMDRILRPEGAVIMRDDVDVLAKVWPWLLLCAELIHGTIGLLFGDG
ncbi:hypothetical protein ACQ4PT_048142 [Festuca glaucescens]